jgi:hypothetical protein
MRLSIALAVAALTLAACGREEITGHPSPAELRDAPASVVVAGQRLVLEADLWRDFMPSSPPDGRPLAAVLRVKVAGGGLPSADVRADHVWVVNGAAVWETTPVEEHPRGSMGPWLEVVARDGPKWGPGVRVDVVVRLRDKSGQAYLLRAADRLIGRTD